MAADEKFSIRLDPEREKWVKWRGEGSVTKGVRYIIDRDIEAESEGIDPRRHLEEVILLPDDAISKRVYLEILTRNLKNGDETTYVDTEVCRRIARKHLKKAKAGLHNVLNGLEDETFLEKDHFGNGYYPIIRSKYKSTDETVNAAIHEFRDYLRLEGKYTNQMRQKKV